jgi:nitrite reductase/ring-hydroxylating ferredoxin subunit
MTWVDALSLAELAAKGKAVIRHDGRQILVIKQGARIHACVNRCPHEGYPLSEGVLTEGCVLTCNWHNWKFDLESGETLIGGDTLPRFPVRIEAGRVLLDLTPPDPATRRAAVLAGIPKALDDVDEQRLVREAARLLAIGADPLDALRAAIAWTEDRLEFGVTHALAGARDWLALFDRGDLTPPERLAALGEILAHIAEDGLGPKRYPLPAGSRPWDEADFLAAIEAEDEATALAHLRGALESGLTPADLEPALVTAALAHYADFGHSLIYAVNIVALTNRIGEAERLLPLLGRSLILATREDLLPEFRDYRRRLDAWGTSASETPPLSAESLRRGAPKAILGIVAAWGAVHPPEAIFATLVEAAAWILLHVDGHALTRVDAKLADSIGWLDFTHALTFAEAGRRAVALRPSLWPALLLQLACFIGRNTAYVDPAFETTRFAVTDPAGFVAARLPTLLDHGRDRFIISVHLVKTLTAGGALIGAVPAAAPPIAAALHRFLDAPMKGRHVLRTANQMWDLVGEE